MRNKAISLLAANGKYVVDVTSMDYSSKETIKFSIDIGAEVLKELLERIEKNSATNSQLLNDVTYFKVAARKCGLKKIVRVVIEINNTRLPYYYMEGGDVQKFSEMVGIHLFPEVIANVINPQVKKMARLNGEVIYSDEVRG